MKVRMDSRSDSLHEPVYFWYWCHWTRSQSCKVLGHGRSSGKVIQTYFKLQLVSREYKEVTSHYLLRYDVSRPSTPVTHALCGHWLYSE